jgi:hypothetical protein
METGGTALDHSLIGVTNDMTEGAAHDVSRLPFVLIGTAGGAIKSGRVVKLGTWVGKTGNYWTAPSGIAHNLLLATMAGALGVTGTTPMDFGGSGYAGNLATLLA